MKKIELRANYHGACYDMECCDPHKCDHELYINGELICDFGDNEDGPYVDNEDVDGWKKLIEALLGEKIELTIDDNFDRR